VASISEETRDPKNKKHTLLGMKLRSGLSESPAQVFRSRMGVAQLLSKYGTVLALLGLIVAFSIKFPGLFPTQANVLNILSSVAITGIAALGLTIVLGRGV